QHAIQPHLVESLAGQPELLVSLPGIPAHPPESPTPRTLSALAAACLLHEAVLREGPQMEGAVRRRLAEHLAGLRGGKRPRVAERLEQCPAQRMGQRPHCLRVVQVELRQIVLRMRPVLTRLRPVLAFASPVLSSPVLSSPVLSSPVFSNPVCSSLVCSSP